MRPAARRHWVAFAWLTLALVVSASSARGEVATDQPAAMLVFPYVTVDGSQSADTFVQLSNTSTDPVVVQCFYEFAVTPGPPISCIGAGAVDFQFQLTPRQPIGWRASEGLLTFPLDGVSRTGPGGAFNANSRVPPVPTDPYVGSLRCIAVDANLVPVERNVLIGTATLGQPRQSGESSIDVAQYNAIGFSAHDGAGNGDDALLLGGPNAEYDACPQMNVIPHFFDGALEPTSHASRVSTTLVLVPCSQDLLHQLPSQSVVVYDVYNEFEQHFSTSKAMNCQQVSTLSTIDSADPSRSIYNVRVSGTLTGQTRMQTSMGGGVLALAIETHTDMSTPTLTTRAAFNAHMVGSRTQADTVVVFGGPPPEDTPSPTATSTATLPPTATATPSATRTATPTSTSTAKPTATLAPTNTATVRPTSTPSATQPAPTSTAMVGNGDDGCSMATGPQRDPAAALALLLGPALLLLRSGCPKTRRASR